MKAAQKAKEKVKEIMALGKMHGPTFLAYAIAMDVLDELIIPGMFAYLGFPALSIISLIADLDWMTYPAYFALVMIWQKITVN